MSVNRQEISQKIIRDIAEHLSIPVEQIDEHRTLDSLGADSLDHVELVMKLEEQFDIEVDDAAAEKLMTVGALIDYVCEHCK